MSTLVTKRLCLAFVGALTSAAAIHCSSDPQKFETKDESVPDAEPPPATPFVDAAVEEEASAPLPDVDCADENKKIYVLSANDKQIYRFDPIALTFTSLGRPACATRSAMYSMAVDRRGFAWIEYQDGRLFKVNTADMTCADSGFRRDAYGFGLFGMGFAKNDGDTGSGVNAGETLWVIGAALGRLDTTTLDLSIVGKGGLGSAELSGTGVGTLYAFMSGAGGRVAQLDKTTGEAQKFWVTGVENLGAWAFAAWGGEFWLFTSPPPVSGTETSTVTKYSPTTEESTVLMEDVGLQIVGAGVSTCAPTEPPH